MSPKKPGTSSVRKFSGGNENTAAKFMGVPMLRMDSPGGMEALEKLHRAQPDRARDHHAQARPPPARGAACRRVQQAVQRRRHGRIENVLRMTREDLHRHAPPFPATASQRVRRASQPSMARNSSGPQTIVQRLGRWPA